VSRLSTFLQATFPSIAQRSKVFRLTRAIERHNLPAAGWGAKGFEFWTFLSVLLVRTNYSRILELGSGRSTIIFAEYAKFRGAGFTSIETNRKWYNKARMELRWQGMDVNPIHLLTMDKAVGWYDVEQLRSLAQSRGPFDFVMIDGPNEASGNSRGIRDSETALNEIIKWCGNSDVMMVDDVHRRHIFDSINRLLVNRDQYEKWFYDYAVDNAYSNSLCLCVKKGSPASKEIPGVVQMLGLRLYTTLQREDCSQD
jgi:hypothetical protein